MSDYVEVALDSIYGGAAIERFKDALDDVIQNILDPNVESGKTREIHLVFRFKPDANNSSKVMYDFQCKTKLAHPQPLGTVMWVGQKDGEIAGYEQDITQQELPFNDEEKQPDFKVVNMGERHD